MKRSCHRSLIASTMVLAALAGCAGMNGSQPAAQAQVQAIGFLVLHGLHMMGFRGQGFGFGEELLNEVHVNSCSVNLFSDFENAHIGKEKIRVADEHNHPAEHFNASPNAFE